MYDVRGRRVAGTGGTTSALAALAVDGHKHDGPDVDALSVVVPVLSDTTVASSVRAAISLAVLRRRIATSWALLALLAALVPDPAVIAATRAARRISVPFEQLTVAARGLGSGQANVQLAAFGNAETDATGAALTGAARSVDELLTQERDFVRHASHQLRTPQAALVVHLEREPLDVPADSRAHASHIDPTRADLLAVRSTTSSARCHPTAVTGAAVCRWNTTSRRVTLRADDQRPAALSEAALRQFLSCSSTTQCGTAPATSQVETPLGHQTACGAVVSGLAHGVPVHGKQPDHPRAEASVVLDHQHHRTQRGLSRATDLVGGGSGTRAATNVRHPPDQHDRWAKQRMATRSSSTPR